MLISLKELEKMSIDDRKKYYSNLKEYCENFKLHDKSSILAIKGISKISPLLRKYDLEIYGEENIPPKDTSIFICNHSNSHEFFTIREAFSRLNMPITPFGASDCLTPLSKKIFELGDVTLIDRSDKASSENGLFEFTKKILDGKNGIIFSESTWNLHPYLPMQPLKVGGTQVSVITKKAIIPTIFEYIERNDVCRREKDIYTKCIVLFGKPLYFDESYNIINATNKIKEILENMRKELWAEYGIKKESIDSIDKDIYLNHTYLKKFDALGFTFNSQHEFQFLLNSNKKIDNEYCLDEEGNLVPGITLKDKKILLYR